MKAKARSITWRRNMNKNIEQLVNSCIKRIMCARNNPKMKPLERKLGKPWERIHVYQSKYFLIVVDSQTKWFEVPLFSKWNVKLQ